MLLVDFIMVAITAVLTLYANWSLDRTSYTIFLHQLLGVRDQEELAKRNFELQALSSTDALTGIGNRRAAEAAVEELWRGARQGGRLFALAIIDVDFFKLFNDHYGHVAGDTCLRMVAETAQSAARRSGARVYRLGGEEFVMIMPCDHARTALDAAGAIRDAVLNLDIPHLGRTDTLRCVSVSIGVAFSGDVTADRVSDFLQAADCALYRVKSAGRNGVVPFSQEMTAPAPVDPPRGALSGA